MKPIHLFLLLIFSFSLLKGQPANLWVTKFETSNFRESPGYKETMTYFSQFEEVSEYAKMFSFGVSPQGRDLNCIVISTDRAFTPAEAKATGKPVIMITNGIHSGEIEGKDACMILLREMLVSKEKADYLNDVILLIVPIFSIDGHERSGKYNRINQNGPVEMGWRTTSQGYNLNRDWVKADTPEMQAMVKLFSEWLPDFFIDSHTTDGADYQYTITYGMDTHQNVSQEIADFNKNKFLPYFKKSVEENGYLVWPYVYFRDWKKGFDSGLTEGAAPPRFSNNYVSVRNRLGFLLETHMMKTYKERVFSTKIAIESIIKFCKNNASEIHDLIKRSEENDIQKYIIEKKYYPLAVKLTEKTVTEKFKGKAYSKMHSDISGTEKIVYSDKDSVLDVTIYRETQIADSVTAPRYYLIPQEWKEIVERMKLHGIKVDTLNTPQTLDVTRCRFTNIKFDPAPNEGHQRVNFETIPFSSTVTVPPGTYKINSNQPALGLILHMLEPKGEDSFVKWGFFNNIFSIKEYYEDYVMEKMAEEMLKNDTELKKEFENKLASDETFRNDPDARLEFFYRKTPYFDTEYCLYPVMRVE